jgi:hypothetical protein
LQIVIKSIHFREVIKVWLEITISNADSNFFPVKKSTRGEVNKVQKQLTPHAINWPIGLELHASEANRSSHSLPQRDERYLHNLRESVEGGRRTIIGHQARRQQIVLHSLLGWLLQAKRRRRKGKEAA